MFPSPDEPFSDGFPTTRWSLVAAAGLRADEAGGGAFAEFCRIYWYPIYAFIRRKGASPDDAKDLTQAYFTRLLESQVLAAADRHKGRFRAFLRTDCGFFLADQRDRESALKRGGGVSLAPIDAIDVEGRYRNERADQLSADRLFDRACVLGLLDDVLASLAHEYADSGRTKLFNSIKSALTGESRDATYAETASELGTTEVAVQSAVQRLRRRYRDLLVERITLTLHNPSPSEIDEEIRDLFAALGN